MPGYSQNKGETEFFRMVVALLVSALFFFSLPASGACRDFSVAGKTITPGTMQGIKLSWVLGKLPLYFITNQGQKNRRIHFFAQDAGQAIFHPGGHLSHLSSWGGKASPPG